MPIDRKDWYKSRMSTPDPRNDRDYVLGTHDAEVERLGFQHSIWREEVLRAWMEAGIGLGSRVVDIGAGPGFASLDLAELVGPTGSVLATERSGRFLKLLTAEARRRGLPTIETCEIDLMHDAIPLQGVHGSPIDGARRGSTGFDAAWCRWVACFVSDPALLVKRISAALRPGGAAIFHEYVEYGSYQLLPPRHEAKEFIEAVSESWRAGGGEPNIARVLPKMLVDAGFELKSLRPIARAARTTDPLWNWPAGFMRINVPRMVDLGVRSEAWGRSVLRALDEAERDPASIFITPTVLEIIAIKRPTLPIQR